MRVDESGLAFYNVFQHPSSLIQFPAAHADETDLESHRAVTGAELHGFEEIRERFLILIIPPEQEAGIEICIEVVRADF